VLLASALDQPGEAFDQTALALSRWATLTVLLIQDAFELRPPPGSYRYATDLGLVAHTSMSTLRGPQKPDLRVKRLRRIGVDVVPIDASADLRTVVRQVASSSNGRR
jgi:hypothetical protein